MPVATMSRNKFKDVKVKTNVEKKTKTKISKMTEDVSTMDFVLKNIKLLNRLKRCRVRLSKVKSANLLSKKKKEFGKIKSKEVSNKGREGATKNKTEKKPKKNPTQRVSPEFMTMNDEEEDLKYRSLKRVCNSNQEKKNIQRDTPKEKEKSRKSESPVAKKHQTRKSTEENLDKNKRKEKKKGRKLYIQLPFLGNAKIRSLNKEILEREAIKNKKVKKRVLTVKRLGRTYLTEKFGGRYFRCHVKVARYRDPNYPAHRKKKNNSNRKSVSFVETVEIFGESDDDNSSVIDITLPSVGAPAPAQDTNNSILSNESNDSEGSVSGSPRKRKISSLKSSDIPRSEHIRKSDEKIPRLQTNEEKKDTDKRKKSPKKSDVVTIVPDITKEKSTEAQNEITSTTCGEKTNNTKDKEFTIMLNDESDEESGREKSDKESVKEKNGEGSVKENSKAKSENKKSGGESEKKGSGAKSEEHEAESENEESEAESEIEESEAESEKKESEAESEKEEHGAESEKEERGAESEKKEKKNSPRQKSIDDKTDKEKSPDSIEIDKEHDSEGSESDEGVPKSDEEEPKSDKAKRSNDAVEKSAKNKNTTNHTGSVSVSQQNSGDNNKTSENSESNNTNSVDDEDEEDDLFSDTETALGKSTGKLQLSNNTETSFTNEEQERRNSKTEEPASHNSDPGLEGKDRPQQTKFSLNTFFKSLKTKIMPDANETSPKKNGEKQAVHDEDKSVRDELTIK